MRKLRWGMLGTGNIVSKAGRGIQLSSNGVWHGVAGRHRENGKQAARRFGVPVYYDSYQDLLDDPEIDAVYIALLNHLHREWAIRACHAGKHVLVEKPFALQAEHAREMLAAAASNHVHIAEAFVWKFHPVYPILKERIGKGQIGQVAQVFAHFSFAAPPDSTRWRKEWGGGSLYDVGCYAVAWSRYFMEAEPVAVEAEMTLDAVHQVDRRFSGTLYFPGGRVAQISSALDMKLGSFFQIMGTESRISAHMKLTPETMTVVVTAGDQTEEYPMDRFRMFALQAEHFTKQVFGEAEKDGDEAAQAQVIGALAEAARTRQRIAIGSLR